MAGARFPCRSDNAASKYASDAMSGFRRRSSRTIFDPRQVDVPSEYFPQISAQRIFHQINLNSARRVCSALFCSALARFYRRYVSC
jgi:hypothetical protein